MAYGNNPIPLTFQMPSASARQLQPTNAAFTISMSFLFPSVSSLEKVFWMFRTAWMGPLNSIKTIMMLKICKLLPVMYIPIAFIGNCLAGAMASSHAFFNLSVSISSCEGCLR